MNRKILSDGFIAALDQSGGSSKKTLEAYGINTDSYTLDDMLKLMHDMRCRIIKCDVFNGKKIMGTILFEDTIRRGIDGNSIVDYLANKDIISFMKIDKGLAEEKNGVRLLNEIPDLDELLNFAKEENVYGTKMRSLINSYNEEGIKEIVSQQFALAKKIIEKGLIPIIEPEVNIDASDKAECEKCLKKCLLEELELLPDDYKVIFKLTLPDFDDFYLDIINHRKVLKVVALSGGYSREVALKKLEKNHHMIASFSRALLEGLNINDTNVTFEEKLSNIIDEIYEASIK